jgi:hypothetical protein
MFEAAYTQFIIAKLGVLTHFSAPYAHDMLGKAERPWRTIRECEFSKSFTIPVSTSMWSSGMRTTMYLCKCTFSRTFGTCGGVLLTFSLDVA